MLLNNYMLHAYAQNSGVYDTRIADTLNAMTLNSVTSPEQHMLLVRECMLRADNDEEYAAMHKESISRILVSAIDALCKEQEDHFEKFCKKNCKTNYNQQGCKEYALQSKKNKSRIMSLCQIAHTLFNFHGAISVTVYSYVTAKAKHTNEKFDLKKSKEINETSIDQTLDDDSDQEAADQMLTK